MEWQTLQSLASFEACASCLLKANAQLERVEKGEPGVEDVNVAAFARFANIA